MSATESPAEHATVSRRHLKWLVVGVVGVLLAAAVAIPVISRVNANAAWNDQVAAYSLEVEEAQQEQESTRTSVETAYTDAQTALADLAAKANQFFLETDDEAAYADRIAMKSEAAVAVNTANISPTYTTSDRVVEGITGENGQTRPAMTFFVTTGSQPSVDELTTATDDLQAAIDVVEQAQEGK